jgi:DNA-directed RNA polymerase specialized sigma24 family protein
LEELPWGERAAIALVDQLGLTYAAAAQVLGAHLAEFRASLHRARSVLFAAYRAGAR